MAVRGPSIVTGGGRGIGRAVALALARDGHAVCVNDTGVALDGSSPGPGPAEEVAAEIRKDGGAALAVDVDARTAAGARELMAKVEGWAGSAPSVLVHAAGTPRDAMVHKASDEDWRLVAAEGWDAKALTAARGELAPHLVSLESEFDRFGGPPIAVVGRAR